MDWVTLRVMEHMIPDATFGEMPPIMLLIVAAGGIYFLIKGADCLVEGAAGLAYRLGMPKVIVGATVVSLGTTSPEAAVSVMAAWEGKADLALGNAVGSIIADTGVVFGLGCVLSVLPANRFVLQRQGWVDIGVAFLLGVLCYGVFLLDPNQELGRWVGVLLVALLIVYMCVSVYWSRQHPHGEPFIERQEHAPEQHTEEGPVVKLVGLVLLGLILVIISSRFVIGSVSELASDWGIPKVVIASTIVAMGTSLPELVVGLTAVRKGHKEILIGNVIGADILNVLFVVGVSALAAPLPVVDLSETAVYPNIFLYLHLPTMLLIIGLFLFFIRSSVKRGHFQRWHGYPLLGIYFLFLLLSWQFGKG